MNGDLMPLDVLEDSIVGGRRPPHVVFGLESVDRDADLQARNRCPFDRDRTYCAGHDLDVQAALGEPGQQDVQLAKADERLTSHE